MTRLPFSSGLAEVLVSAWALGLCACAGPRKISTADLSSDLQLQSIPDGAAISEDGRAIGKTPMSLTLTAGRAYSLKLSAPGYAPRTVGGTRESLLRLGGGQLGVVLLPQGFSLQSPPSFDHPEGLAAIAVELEHRKAWGQAIEFWLRVAQLDPRNPRAHRGLGSAWAKLGQDEKAIREYEQYLFLAPDAPDAERVRHAVDSYRGGIDLPGAKDADQ
ncbi:MAG: tetratricopeptide repeat protein [Myxococcales bacterium]